MKSVLVLLAALVLIEAKSTRRHVSYFLCSLFDHFVHILVHFLNTKMLDHIIVPRFSNNYKVQAPKLVEN